MLPKASPRALHSYPGRLLSLGWNMRAASRAKDLVARAAKDLLATNQHGIGKINAQLCTAVDGDEATDCRTPKEENINKGFAINRVFTHPGTCWRY